MFGLWYCQIVPSNFKGTGRTRTNVFQWGTKGTHNCVVKYFFFKFFKVVIFLQKLLGKVASCLHLRSRFLQVGKKFDTLRSKRFSSWVWTTVWNTAAQSVLCNAGILHSLVATSLLISCNRLAKTGWYQNAFTWLATTWWQIQLLQIVYGLLASSLSKLLSTGLLQVISTSCNKSANDKLHNRPDFNRLVATDKFVAGC